VFRALTAHAIGALRESGVDIVFTTPNDRAGRGWEQQGARQLGRLPVTARPRSLRGLVRMVRARTAAERWPVPCDVGRPASRSLAGAELEDLLESVGPPTAIRTHRTVEFLRWRYGYEPLGYRTLTVGDDAREGVAIFRLRHRGAAVEAAVCDLIVPRDDRRTKSRLVGRIVEQARCDYALGRSFGRSLGRGVGLPLPGQGPRVYLLPLGPERTGLDRWDLTLGDVELL
jgi:hypothetical protein